jgi:hypothetical protein
MKNAWTWLAITVGVMILMLLGLRVLDTGPTPPDRAGFDTQRAFQTLVALNPEGVPHPAGSPENRRVRERIEARLAALGYETEAQSEFYCTHFASGCTAIENIIAVKPGNGGEDRDTVMVTAHYDSVPGSPGASDDLAGVAVMLEVARLIADAPLRNDVVFMFADGEETGLRGALAFAENHPLMERVDLVINTEARGVSGPSTMFETSAGNAAIVSRFGGAVARPLGNSLMYDVYRRMPNNTDLTIYKQAGAMGINFAFSRGVALYHSSRDDADHISLNSLGHHGDNVAGVLRDLADSPLDTLSSADDATYVDLFGRILLNWPASFNLPLMLIGLGMTVGMGVLWRAYGWRRSGWAILGLVALVIGHGVTGWVLSFPLGIWPGLHPLDHPYPWPGRLALIAASLILSLVIGVTMGRRAGATAWLFVCWILVGLLGLALAFLLPGATYLALLPMLVFALAAPGEFALRKGHPPLVAAHLGFVALAYMALYHFSFLDVVLNFQLSAAKMLVLVLLGLGASPLAAYYANGLREARLPLAAMAVVLVAATVAGAIVPPYTPDRPRSVNLAYMQTGEAGSEVRDAQWRLFTFGPPAERYAQAAGFPDEVGTFDRYGVRTSDAYLRPAPDLDLKPPMLVVTSDTTGDGGRRRIEGTLQAGEAGFVFGIAFPAGSGIRELVVEGETLLGEQTLPSTRAEQAMFHGAGNMPLSFVLTAEPGEPVEFALFELSALPDHPEAAEIVARRPADTAPLHFGDHAEVQNHYRF